ncbi:MAG: hypothetical protein IIA87_05090 [Nanoarchaeota archaeon]|nr:hypothetical protein [Nanoarchaeota archaeon]
MKKIIAIVILLIIVVGSLFAFVSSGFSFEFESEEKPFDYTWTKALCDGNTCQDYEIVCLNGEVKSTRPVSGFVTFSKNWEDPRENRETLCED